MKKQQYVEEINSGICETKRNKNLYRRTYTFHDVIAATTNKLLSSLRSMYKRSRYGTRGNVESMAHLLFEPVFVICRFISFRSFSSYKRLHQQTHSRAMLHTHTHTCGDRERERERERKVRRVCVASMY